MKKVSNISVCCPEPSTQCDADVGNYVLNEEQLFPPVLVSGHWVWFAKHTADFLFIQTYVRRSAIEFT